jgi:cell division protein ZapA
MREIRDAGKIASIERIALMAALNITHELLSMKVGRGVDVSDFKRRMDSMQAAIDAALAEQDTLF